MIGRKHKETPCYDGILLLSGPTSYTAACRASHHLVRSHAQAQALAPFGHRLYPRRICPVNNPLSSIRQDHEGDLARAQFSTCQASHPSGRAVVLSSRNGLPGPLSVSDGPVRPVKTGNSRNQVPDDLASPSRCEYNLLIVGSNAPGYIPLWQHRLGLLEHVETKGGLFVASVMPQLMSDLENMELFGSTWDESRTQFTCASPIF